MFNSKDFVSGETGIEKEKKIFYSDYKGEQNSFNQVELQMYVSRDWLKDNCRRGRGNFELTAVESYTEF